MMAYLAELTVPDTALPLVPEVHISYGQSWRSNDFPSFAGFALNPQPQTLLACKVNSVGSPTFQPGPLNNSAGIALTGTITGLTGYQGSDTFAIGRCAVLSQQLLRLWRGATSLKPILEFCAAYPGSNWNTGGGGGLSPGAAFTASVVDGTMTVTDVSLRMLSVNQQLLGAGVPANTFILGGPNPGTTGTYNVAVATTVLSTTMTTNGGASFVAGVGAASPNDVLTVTSVTSGTINVGDTIITGMPAANVGTTIRSQLTGPAGGAGTYKLYVSGAHVNIASQSFTSSGTSWRNQQSIINSILNVLPLGIVGLEAQLEARGFGVSPALGTVLDPIDFDHYDPEERQAALALAEASLNPIDSDLDMVLRDILASTPRAGYLDAIFRSVGYTQGGSANAVDTTGKEADLTDMLTLYDGMNLPGTGTKPLNYYIGLPAAISTATVQTVSNWGNYTFCRANAPGRGGPWSGRCFMTAPSYPWQFNGADNIHTGDYGTLRWGEFEGYVKHLVEDLGVAWTPLWRSFTNPIRREGQTIVVPFDRPAGPDFATGVLEWQSDPNDGIKVWPSYGFAIYRSGTALTLSTPVISGLEVRLPVQQTLLAGDSLEVSVGWYGPGGPNPSTQSGIGSNLVMNGPNSLLVPGKRIGAWVLSFVETVTV